MLWTVADRLKEAAGLGQFHWERLIAALRTIDWLDRDALKEAGRVATAAAADFLQRIEQVATGLELPLATVHRNLVLLAPPIALPMHRLAWRAGPRIASAAPGCDWTGWLGHLDSRLGRRRCQLRLAGLCADPPHMSVRDAEAIFPTPTRARFGAMILHARGGMPQTRRDALAALLRAVSRSPDAKPENLVHWSRDLWMEHKLPRLSGRAFDRLPVQLRRAILGKGVREQQCRRALLTRKFRRGLSDNPLSHPDTPESCDARWRRLPAVLNSICRRDFSHDGIAEQLAEPNNAEALAAELGPWVPAIWKPGAGAGWRAPSDVVSAAITGLPPGPVREMLVFLATEPAKRLRDGMPGQTVRTRLSAVDWLATFTASGAVAQATLLTDFSALESWPTADAFSALTAGFASAHRVPGVLQALARRWLHRANGKDAAEFRRQTLAWFRDHPDALSTLPHGAHMTGILLDALIEARREKLDFLSFLSAPLLRQMWRHTSESVGWFSWDVTADLAKPEADPADLRRWLAMLAEADPAILIEAVPDQFRPKAFVRLCDAWPSSLSADAARRLRAVSAVHAERPVWLLVLAGLRRARRPLTDRLHELATSAGPEVLREAFRAYPDAFAEHGPELFSLRPLLRFAFGNVRVAAVLERELPRARLIAELPWVRRTWAHAPSVAAALELALCFSLRDARYLIQLSQIARGSHDPANRGHTFDSLYTVSERPKKNGGTRTITAPAPRLKRLQRRLLANGFALVPLHESARGFRNGESIVTNASPHVGKALVVNLDIQGFFPNTPHRLILGACRKLAQGRLSAGALMLLADLCSYRGALPTGAPTSPAIGNIVLTRADRAIATAAARHGAAYTRYADDLTISGPGDVHRLIPFVKRILGQLGYAIERKKINLFRRGRRQMVTGLAVNEKPSWPRHLRRLLRAAVDRRARGESPTWQGEPLSDERLMGLIAFLNQTAPEEAANLRARLPSLYSAGPPSRGSPEAPQAS